MQELRHLDQAAEPQRTGPGPRDQEGRRAGGQEGLGLQASLPQRRTTASPGHAPCHPRARERLQSWLVLGPSHLGAGAQKWGQRVPTEDRAGACRPSPGICAHFYGSSRRGGVLTSCFPSTDSRGRPAGEGLRAGGPLRAPGAWGGPGEDTMGAGEGKIRRLGLTYTHYYI